MSETDVAQLVEDCENRSEKLSDWEAQFISDIAGQLANGGSLTERQQEKLEEVWERIT